MEDEDSSEFVSVSDHYKVERIVDMQLREDGQTYCLIKWEGWDVSESTWEKYQRVAHLKNLFEQFLLEKKNDGKRNAIIKHLETIQLGDNPYKQTALHGHFLYGDEIDRIVELRVFESAKEQTVYAQIQWKPRNGKEGPAEVSNSIIDTRMIIEHDPQFLIKYYLQHTNLSLRNPSS